MVHTILFQNTISEECTIVVQWNWKVMIMNNFSANICCMYMYIQCMQAIKF